MKLISTRWMAMLASVLLLAPSLLAQRSEALDWKRMQRDLDIMEGVLSKLMTPRHLIEPFHGNVRGVYFEGYGVVFLVDRDGIFHFVWSNNELNEVILHEPNAVIKVKTDPDDPAPVVVASPRDRLDRKSVTGEGLMQQVVEFLGNYADAIGQMRAEDRITVLVLPRSNLAVFDFEPEETRPQNGLVQASARKSDIVDYRRGKLSLHQFRQKLAFKEQESDEAMRRNVEIMANILSTALSQKHNQEFGALEKKQGTYVEGLGVLFFLNSNLLLKESDTFVTDYVRQYLEEVEVDKQRQQRKQVAESFEYFKQVLVELIGDFGHTLRTLPEDEAIIVSVDFDHAWLPEHSLPERLTVQAMKKDLDAYDRGRIDRAELNRRMKIQEF
ncbi:MAG: hypothetical protein ACE5IY_14585 [bacterium]